MPFSPAYALAAVDAPAGLDFISLMPLVLIFVVFHFLLIRPVLLSRSSRIRAGKIAGVVAFVLVAVFMVAARAFRCQTMPATMASSG